MQSGYGPPAAAVEYGRRLMHEWFSMEPDPQTVYTAWEMGWHEFSLKFVAPNTTVNVGYSVRSGSPTWLCKALGVTPMAVGNMFGMTAHHENEGPVFVSGPTYDHPAHPSFSFGAYHDEPNFCVSLALAVDGRLLSLYVFTYNDEAKCSDSSAVNVFFHPMLGQDQPLPKPKMTGPTPQELIEVAEHFEGKRKIQDCRLLSLMQGHRDPFVSEEDGRRKTAEYFRGLARIAPWDWLRGDGR
jgi:hypothetical protein